MLTDADGSALIWLRADLHANRSARVGCSEVARTGVTFFPYLFGLSQLFSRAPF
jgi:hypothetical protein